MIRVAGTLRLSAYNRWSPELSGPSSVLASCSYSSSKEPAPVITSMRTPIGENDETPPPQQGGEHSSKRGGRLKYLLGGAAAVAGITLLCADENTRLAAVEAVPAIKPAFEFFNLSTSPPKKLTPAPQAVSKLEELPSRNTRTMEAVANRSAPVTSPPEKVVDCTRGIGNRDKGFSVVDTASRSVTPFKPPSATPKSRPDRAGSSQECGEQGNMVNVANNSVKFLLSGKRPVDDAVLADRPLIEAERQCEAARKRAEERERTERELREAKAAVDMERDRERARKRTEALQLKKREEEDSLYVENVLSGFISDLVSSASNAVRCNNSALDASRNHSELLRNAMHAESNREAQAFWDELKEMKDLRDQRKEEALELSQRVTDELKQFVEIVDAARSKTGSNPALVTYRSQARALLSDVKVSTALLDNAESVGDTLAAFYQRFLRDRPQFQRDLVECVPGTAFIQAAEGRMKDDEMHELLAQAHRRIYQLKKQILERDALADLRAADALREQSKRNNCEYHETLSKELTEQHDGCHDDLHKQMQAETTAQEEAIRAAVGKQARDLNKQLRSTLNAQLCKLMEQYEKDMKARLLHEKKRYVEDMAKSTALVEGLMSALNDRCDVDRAVARVRDLVGVSRRLLYDMLKAESAGAEKVELKQPINCLRQLACGSEFVTVITNSIPKAAYHGGIYTKSALESRFHSVLQQCKKVAKLSSSNNILSQTVNSVYNHLFSWEGPPRFTDELNFEMNVKCMSNTDLLIQANYFMKQGCLGAAVKCMVHLEEMPRAAAQDWINEARCYLEARQAADALYTYALSQLMSTIV